MLTLLFASNGNIAAPPNVPNFGPTSPIGRLLHTAEVPENSIYVAKYRSYDGDGII